MAGWVCRNGSANCIQLEEDPRVGYCVRDKVGVTDPGVCSEDKVMSLIEDNAVNDPANPNGWSPGWKVILYNGAAPCAHSQERIHSFLAAHGAPGPNSNISRFIWTFQECSMLSYGPPENKDVHDNNLPSWYSQNYYLKDHFVMQADLEARQADGAIASEPSAAYFEGGALNGKV